MSGTAPADGRSGAAPVQVGVHISANADEFYGAIGLEELSLGDNRAQALAVIEVINEGGGLAGHPIVPVFATKDAASASSTAVQEQAACETWTRDNDVFAVVSPLQPSIDNLIPCLSAADTPLLGGGALPYDAHDFAAFPDHFFSAYMLNLTRMAQPWIDRMAAKGYFEGPVRLGLVRYDQPTFERAKTQGLVPALARHGVEIVSEAVVEYPQGGTDVGTVVQQAQAAALRFKTEQVSHVVFLEGGGGLPLSFMVAAEEQNYRPRYGLHTYNGPGVLLQTSAPPAQLRRSLGIGSAPLLDVDARRDDLVTSARKRCREIMVEAGQDMSNRLTEAVALAYCDSLFLLDAAVEAGGLTVSGVRRGIEGLGEHFRTAVTFETRFGPAQHDGATAVRDLVFDGGCSCFRYDSAPMRIE